MDIGFYLRIFLRRLPYFLVILVLGTAAGLSLAVILPPVYHSQATLIVESEQIPEDLASSTVRTGAIEQLSIIQQRMLSRSVLLEIANDQGVYAGEPPMAADEKVEDMRRRVSMETSGGGGGPREPQRAIVVVLQFSAPTGSMAADVVNAMVTFMLQENVEMRRTTAGQTLDFFTDETSRLDRELNTLSQRILDFRADNLNALPDSLEFRRSQQSDLQERLSQLEREEATLRDRRDRLRELVESGAAVNQPEDAGTPEAQQLRELKNRYSNSVAVLSEDNPKMTVMQRRITALEQIVTEQQAADAGVETTDGQAPSAAEIQLSDIDGQLDYIADQRDVLSERMAALDETIQATPGNASTLETLQRDYDNIQEQYNRAVAARARAETGDVIESMSKGQRISVVEQATTPSEPDSPNRPFIALAGIGGGLAGGLALVVLLEVLNNAIRRPVEITNKLGIAPFATVPYLRTAAEIRRRRSIILGTVAAICIGVPAGLWLVNTQVTPLMPLFDDLMSRLSVASIDTAGPGLVA